MSGAITATAAVVAAMTLTQVFTAVAVVGAVVGAVGMVTGVKELQYVGMALGAVGAIGGFAASAGLFAADALSGVSAVASAGSGVGGAYTTAEAMGMAVGFEGAAGLGAGAAGGMPIATGVAESGSLSSGSGAVFDTMDDLINTVSGQYMGPGAAMAPDVGGLGAGEMSMSGMDGGLTPSADVPMDGFELAQAPVPPGTATPTVNPADAVAPGTTASPAVLEPVPQPGVVGQPQVTGTPIGQPGSGTVSLAPDGSVMAGGQPVTAAPPGAPYTVADVKAAGLMSNGAPSSWDKVMDLIGKPGVGTLLSGGISAAGAFISGATSTLTPAQVKALEAQAGYNQASSNLAKQQAKLLEVQQANVTGRIPSVSRTTPVPAGLINQAA